MLTHTFINANILLLTVITHVSFCLTFLDVHPDTMFSLPVSDTACISCIVEDEFGKIPLDFCVDSLLNVYIIETVYNTVKKFDKTGALQWNLNFKSPLWNVIYYLNNKVYIFTQDSIIILYSNSGVLLNKLHNPLKYSELQFIGDNIYIHNDILYAFSDKYDKNNPDIKNVAAIDLKNFKLLPASKLSESPILGCQHCFPHLDKLHTHDIKGQSNKYLFYSIAPLVPKGSGKEILIFNKISKKKYITNLSQYHAEPADFKELKFASDNVAVFIAISFKSGFISKGYVVEITLP